MSTRSNHGASQVAVAAANPVHYLISTSKTLPDALVTECTRVLSSFLEKHDIDTAVKNDEDPRSLLAQQSCRAARVFQCTAGDKGNHDFKTRKLLEQTSLDLLMLRKHKEQESQTFSGYVSLALVLAFLSINEESYNDKVQILNRAAASAISSTMSKNRLQKNEDASSMDEFTLDLVHALVKLALMEGSEWNTSLNYPYQCPLDLHIVTTLSKIGKVGDGTGAISSSSLQRDTADLLGRMLQLNDEDEDASCVDDMSLDGLEADGSEKKTFAAALALACRIAPWDFLSPASCVTAAICWDLWFAAEKVCESSCDPTYVVNSEHRRALSVEAVHKLVDTAIESRSYRNADNFATRFFNQCSHSRFLEARYLHACDTIAKVICKRALPVIEKQAERIDYAVEKIQKSNSSNAALCSTKGSGLSNSNEVKDPQTSIDTAKSDIRTFALRQLEESGDIDTAHRLANIWEMDYVHDPVALKKALQARRERYLQWEDFFPNDPVPELVATPHALIQGFASLTKSVNDELTVSDDTLIYGFDVEWGESDPGAAILQVATRSKCILIDIPALSQNTEGSDALESTVGRLFQASAPVVVVGFACRQDLSRLRSSPCVRKKHWFSGAGGVLDLQKVITGDNSNNGKLGLSRNCEIYLGKPLDKAEQCSLWSSRPLTREQRVYAALDAFVCAEVYSRIISSDSLVGTSAQGAHTDMSGQRE